MCKSVGWKLKTTLWEIKKNVEIKNNTSKVNFEGQEVRH